MKRKDGKSKGTFSGGITQIAVIKDNFLTQNERCYRIFIPNNLYKYNTTSNNNYKYTK